MAAQKTRKKTTKAPSAKQLAARRKFALAAKARSKAAKAKRPAKKAAKKRNGKTIIKAKRVTILNLTKKKNPPRKANITSASDLAYAGTAKKATQDGVKGWQLGSKFFPGSATTKAQKITASAYLDLRTGDVWKRKAKGNPKRKRNLQMMAGGHPIRASVDYDPSRLSKPEHASRAATSAQKARRKATQKKIKAAGGVKKYVRKIKTRKAATRKASQSKRMTAATKQRKATTTRLASRSLQRSVPLKKTRRNPDTPAQLLNDFRGYPKDRDDNLRFPNGTPSGLYRLGVLKKIVTTDNAIDMPSNQVWLCADTKGKLYVGGLTKGASKGRVVNAPAGSLGKVTRVEYLEKKPHLGDHNKTLYFHKMGEETGEKPTLYSDGDGNLLFKGGNYSVTYRGIVN